MGVSGILKSYKTTLPLYEARYFLSFPLALIVVALLVFYLLASDVATNETTSYFRMRDAQQIKAFAKAKEQSDISAVMLGSSRLRHALRAGFDPEDLLVMEEGRTLALLQVSVNAARFLDFQDMASGILAARPDYLFIGREVLSNGRADRQKAVLYARSAYDHIRNIIMRPDDADREILWQEERRGLEKCVSGFTPELMKNRLEHTKNRDHHSLDVKENKNLAPLRAFLKEAEMRGIYVVILHIAPNKEVLDRYNVPLHKLDAHGMTYMPTEEEFLPELYSEVSWLDYEDPSGAVNYCDFVHLNEKGRVLFKEWFFKELESLPQ